MTWDIPADNRPIPDGLAPEKDATLADLHHDDWLSREAVESFERDTAGVEVSTFNGTDDALDKIRTAPTSTSTPQLRPDRLAGPAVCLGRSTTVIFRTSRMSGRPSTTRGTTASGAGVPYTVYSTGIGWRTDQITADIGALANPYDALWDPAHRDQTAIIDDVHTAMSMVLLKLGITDVNTFIAGESRQGRGCLDQMRKNTAGDHRDDVHRTPRRADRSRADVVGRHDLGEELPA